MRMNRLKLGGEIVLNSSHSVAMMQQSEFRTHEIAESEYLTVFCKRRRALFIAFGSYTCTTARPAVSKLASLIPKELLTSSVSALNARPSIEILFPARFPIIS